MPIAGDLSQVPLPQVLEMLQQQARAGLLTIAAGAKETTLYFDGESVRVFSVNGQKAMRIGDVLLEHERITEFQLKHALERQAETKQRLGEILVDLGLVSSEEIEQAVGTQAEEEIFEIFALRDGQFRFAERELAEYEYRPDPSAPDHPFPVERLVTDVAQRVAEWQELSAEFRGDGDIFVVPSESRTQILQQLPDGAPKRMAELLNGTNTIGDLVHRLLLPRYKIYRTLAELVRDGHARQASPEELRGTARRLRDDKQVKQAVKLLEHAFSVAPENAEVVGELAEIHEAVGDKKRAGSFYKALADIHFNSGATDQGALVCAKVLEFLPSDPYPHERLVEHYIARDQRTRALDSARTLLRLYQHSGEIDRATELCTSFLEMFPDDLGLHERMVNLHLAAGRQTDAVGEYETVARLIEADSTREPQQRDKERLEIFQKILLIDKSRDDLRKLVEQLSGTADEAVVARKAVRRRSLLVVGLILALVAAGAGFYEVQARGEFAALAERAAALADDGGQPLLARIRVREELERDLLIVLKRYGFATIAGDAEATATRIKLQLDELNALNTRLLGELRAKYGDAEKRHQDGEWDDSDALCDEIIARDHEGTWRGKATALKARNAEERKNNFERTVIVAIDQLEGRTKEALAQFERAGKGDDPVAVEARRVVRKELEDVILAFRQVLEQFESGEFNFPVLKDRVERLQGEAVVAFQSAVIREAARHMEAGERFKQAGQNSRWETAREQFHLAWIMLGHEYMEGNAIAAKNHGDAEAARDDIDAYFAEAEQIDAQRQAALRNELWHDALGAALRLNEKLRNWPPSRDGKIPLHVFIETVPSGAAVWRQGADTAEGTTPCAVPYSYARRTTFLLRLPGWEQEVLEADGTRPQVRLELKKTWVTRFEASGFSQGNRPAGRGAVTSRPLVLGDTLVLGGRVRRLQWIDLPNDRTTAEYDLQLLGELRASPIQQGEWLYLVSTNNDLVHRVAATGDPKREGAWVSHRLPSAPVGPPLMGGPGDVLVVVCGNGELTVLDPASGVIAITHQLPARPFGDPARNIYGVWWVAEDGTLRCTEPASGTELAALKLPVRPTGNIISTDEHVIVPVGDEVWVFGPDPESIQRAPRQCTGAPSDVRAVALDGDRVWFGAASGDIGAWDLTKGGDPILGPRPAPGTNPAAPLRVGDALIVGTSSGDVSCLDAATLNVRWHVALQGRVQAQPIAWGDRVLLPCDDGHVYVFQR